MGKTVPTVGYDHLGIGGALSKHRLRVPPNQREYSWEREHVDDLFGDFANAIRERKSTYFLGTVVRTAGDIPSVVDGQQRLATTTILLAAIRDYLHTVDEKLLCEAINHTFLYTVDRDLRDTVPRLTLNTQDNEFFRRRILELPESEQRSIKAKKRSHELIDQAANIAAERVQTIVKNQSGQKSQVDALNDWLNFIERNATVIVLTAPDGLNAYKMFETLNDRGLKTSQADLLKNYLFGEADDRLDEAQQKWAGMVSSLDGLDIDDVVVTYLRHLASALHGLTREKDVYERLQANIAGRHSSLEFLNKLDAFAGDYAAILTPTSKKWNDYDPQIRSQIQVIQDFRVAQIRPLMLAVASKFIPPEAERAFRNFVCWSVRFLIAGGGRGGALEEAYADAAQKVMSGTVADADGLTQLLRKTIPSDGEFESAFSTARVSTHSLARYYLRAMEAFAARKAGNPEVGPVEDPTVVNLEHILPQNASDNWSHVDPETASAYSKRIGNLVLLNARRNSIIGGASFADKVTVFGESAISLTKDVATKWGHVKQWGPQEINDRQRQLAKLAVLTWPLSTK